jgi:hypothetical protein
MIRRSVIENAPTLFIQTGKEQSALFAMNFARDVRHFVLRMTGGCGLMEAHDAVGLKNLEDALAGHCEDGRILPRFSGFGLFGGTRMLNAFDPSLIVPGVTEIFPRIAERCTEAVFLGVIAKIGTLKYTPYGVVLSEEPGKNFFTVIHPGQHSTVLLQPTSDARASYDDEFKECARICGELRKLGWHNLLLVYNGGGVTEREILTWAELGKQDPDGWKVLIVNGSGRIADKYAADKEFLAEHPHVHVAENSVEEIRAKLAQLGALTMPGAARQDLPACKAG